MYLSAADFDQVFCCLISDLISKRAVQAGQLLQLFFQLLGDSRVAVAENIHAVIAAEIKIFAADVRCQINSFSADKSYISVRIGSD